MQTHGFRIGRAAYVDGPFNKINWTNTAALNGAIANVGPVKIGVASANLSLRPTRPSHTWDERLGDLRPPDGPAWKSLREPLRLRVLGGAGRLFERYGVHVNLPSGMPPGLCYAMFTWGSIGIVDRQSLMNITGEAWVRNPPTIVKNLDQ